MISYSAEKNESIRTGKTAGSQCYLLLFHPKEKEEKECLITLIFTRDPNFLSL